ncbi:MAG TPA: hypothetical protein VK517_19540 [Cyclobacteriaceae bacterium]|nr:hypothetical protein [Cyclobacteriaceae bacterium]
MIYRPSNPLSVAFFLFSLILTGLFWIAEWGIAQYHLIRLRMRSGQS